MTETVQRNYLEISSIKDLKEVSQPSKDYSLNLLDPINFQLNKFFYKNIGKKHKWVDRLIWTEEHWIEYVSSDKVKTYIFKFKDDLVEAYDKVPELVSHVHLPVQSGSSKILTEMNRKHSINDYIKIFEKLKKARPSIKLSSDFIIAYPGEEESDFEESIKLMKKIKFINSYSFIFSPRPGTPASNLKTIDAQVAKKRLLDFQNISNEIKKNYRNNLLNTKAKVLFENQTVNKNNYFGRDEHFNSVIVSSKENLVGKVKDVFINKFNQTTLFGEIILKKNNVAA